MAEPISITCTVNPCVVQLEFVTPLMNIDLEGGALIAGAVTAVWAAGWAIRSIIRTLNSDSVSTTESEI